MDQKQNLPENSKKPRPYWVPADIDFERLPQEVQVAVVDILSPAYRELVLEATSSLERSTGLSCVYVLWLEILGQHDLATKMLRMVTSGEGSASHQEAIGRHLRLCDSKLRLHKLLIQARAHEDRRYLGSSRSKGM